MSKTSDDIKNEVQRTKPGVKVTEVVHLPKARSVFKVKFQASQMVRRCLEEGLLIFGQSFPINALSQDAYVSLAQCMRCYSFDHIMKHCPHPRTYQVCSNCSSKEHRYDRCASVFKKCLTCDGDHPTLAARCPNRKRMIQAKTKDIRDQSRVKSGVSYASAASTASTSNTSPQASPWKKPLPDQSVIINTALIQANIAEAASPGCFQRVLDLIYKANGLSPVIIPKEARMTTEITSHLKGNSTSNVNEVNSQQQTNTSSSDMDIDLRIIESDAEVQPGTSSATDDDNHISSRPTDQVGAIAKATPANTPKEVIATTKPRKLEGLKLYGPHSFNYAKAPTTRKLHDFIFKSKKLKYTYTEECEDAEMLMIDGKIDLTCAMMVSVNECVFKRIKSGFTHAEYTSSPVD